MSLRNYRSLALLLALACIMVVGGCKKKQPAPPPPPPPPPAAPSASLSASPTAIEKGQSTTLTWNTQNATDVSIDGIGAVQPSGSQSVTPDDSTTYRLSAKGPGGSQEATARVTVTAPPPPPQQTATVSETDEQAFARVVKPIWFDYDSYEVRPDQQSQVQANAQFFTSHPNLRFTVEGHADERGSTEYNLALGDNRANAVKQALVQAGVPADRVNTVSFGKEKPFCTESNESCWQQNRRGHFVLSR